MLPTFVIGLREGLESALIVSIIATFLRRNGVGLRAMWVGVGAAVLLSIGVGVTLSLVEQSLPQREQEGLETVIGAMAVVFVTAMIVWMRSHARHLRHDLEVAAEAALTSGTGRALVLMAFLAVLREGFETSVFLLSTFQSSTDTTTAAAGAVLGVVVAVAIGVGIYSGGVRLNLTAFFKYTGVFLVLVAAGLVLSALRTAHEAGWVSVGQGRTLDLDWLAPNGAVRTALVSGVLGIPADPRVVELLGWLCYLVPLLALVLWPQRLRPAPHAVPRARLALAGSLVVAAAVLVVAVPDAVATVPAAAPLDGGGTATIVRTGPATATLTVDASGSRGAGATTVDLGDPVTSASGTVWQRSGGAPGDLPARLSLATLLTYTGNRAPVGLDVRRNPGPFRATWATKGDVRVTTVGDGDTTGLVAGSATGGLVLTLQGGGLTSPRVVTVDDPRGASTWQLDADHVAAVRAGLADARVVQQDRELWQHWFPGALLLAAVALALSAVGLRRRSRVAPEPGPGPTAQAAPAAASAATPGSATTPAPAPRFTPYSPR